MHRTLAEGHGLRSGQAKFMGGARHALCLVSLVAFWSSSSAFARTGATTDAGHSLVQKGAIVHSNLQRSVTTGMKGVQKVQMSGDTDRDFATLMKLHHHAALEMAQLVLLQGKSPDLKAMALQSIATRKREIAHFDRWLASKAHTSMPKGSSVGEDMKQFMRKSLEHLQLMPMTGDIDRDFAKLMKLHHQGAIGMAQMELAQGKSPEIKTMAGQTATVQKIEIAKLDRWLVRQK